MYLDDQSNNMTMTMQKVSNSIPCNHNRPFYRGQRNITPKIEGNRLQGAAGSTMDSISHDPDRLQKGKKKAAYPAAMP